MINRKILDALVKYYSVDNVLKMAEAQVMYGDALRNKRNISDVNYQQDYKIEFLEKKKEAKIELSSQEELDLMWCKFLITKQKDPETEFKKEVQYIDDYLKNKYVSL
jgi:hypothetical protein